MAYQLPPLPYDPSALEPHIDAQTMQIHHGKHHAAYVNNLNAALLQLTRVRRNVSEIVGEKHNAMTEPAENCYDLQHPERSRVAIVHRQMMINHQNVLPGRSSRSAEKADIPLGWSPPQFITPYFCEG